MIALGLWFLVLGVAAVPEAPIQQQTYGQCSPAVSQTGGNVTVNMNCPGVDPKALEALNRDIRFTKEELRSIRELLQQARATPDTQVRLQAETLVRQGKLREADSLLNPPVISMAQYQALQPGMSYQEVVRVLGRPGEEVSRGENILGYVWRNPDYSMVTVVFINGRMAAKNQAGLR